MAVRFMIIVRRHMLIHVDTWWYFLFIRYTFFVVLRYFEKTFCYIVGFFIYWYCPKHADITMLFDDVNLWWFIKQIKGYLILHVIFFFKYSNLLYTNIYTYFYTWPAECTWDTDGGERTVPKSSGHCLPHPRKASLCHWKITLKSVPKDVFTTLFTCITLYQYTTGTVKREWPLLELNIFKFHPTFSSYVYAIR